MRITDIASHERPRERLFSDGPSVLSDRELLALILRNGTRDRNAIELATALLSDFGDLFQLSRAHADEVARVKGVGAAKAASIVAAFHLAGRVREGSEQRRIINTKDVAELAMTKLAGLRKERSIVLIGDAAHNIRHIKTIADGAIDHVLLPVRDVLQLVLRHDGKSFALAHNHPSGDISPSEDDLQVTRKIADAARVLDLRFLDHVVVADDKWRRIEWR